MSFQIVIVLVFFLVGYDGRFGFDPTAHVQIVVPVEVVECEQERREHDRKDTYEFDDILWFIEMHSNH